MNSSYSQRFRVSLGIVALSCLGFTALAVQAQPRQSWPIPLKPQPRLSPETTAETARAFLQLNRVQHLCQKPLAFSVMKGSLEDIAAAVQKAINDADAKNKIRVEVRNVQPVRLTFAAKTSTVGDILSSAATLADAQLWVFGDRLLLAPRKALLPGEIDSVEKGLAIESQGQSDQNENQALFLQDEVFTAFIGDELKGLKTSEGKSKNSSGFSDLVAPNAVVALTTFGQLSSDAQETLRELSLRRGNPLVANPPAFPITTMPDLSLSPGTLIAITTNQGSKDDQDLNLFFPGSDGLNLILNWGVGRSSGGYRLSQSMTPPSRPVVPFDPSAGKS